MKHNTYADAVGHLEFSDRLYETVIRKGIKPRRGYRIIRFAAIAAVTVCLMATSAFAVSPDFRAWTISQLSLGVSKIELTTAVPMEFTTFENMDSISVRYMKLNGTDYHFNNGMLYNSKPGLLRITDDYQLENVQTQIYRGVLEKNGLSYRVFLDYSKTEAGIVAHQKEILTENENGEVFLNLTDGNSNQWPAYVNLSTGVLRDALPEFTDDDFEGRVTYGDQLFGGILISTIVNDGVVIDGNSVSYNKLYWIGDGVDTAIDIDLPDDVWTWNCVNNALYYTNTDGYLYRLNETFEFEQVTYYKTGDDLTNGLLTAATDLNELVICDIQNGTEYIVKDLLVDPGKYDAASGGRVNGNLDETIGYNAKRYGDNGRIALVETQSNTDDMRIELLRIGVLNVETGQLQFVEIDMDCWGYRNGWLDENRFAVIYEGDDGDYLCIYEFE